jgi:hypothetical protein
MTHLNMWKSRLTFTNADSVRYKGRESEVVIEVSPLVATCSLAGTRTRYEVSWLSESNSRNHPGSHKCKLPRPVSVSERLRGLASSREASDPKSKNSVLQDERPVSAQFGDYRTLYWAIFSKDRGRS